MPSQLTRRNALKLSGLALGGLTVGGIAKARGQASDVCALSGSCYPNGIEKAKYSYFDDLDEFEPMVPWGTQNPLLADEMRIIFVGSGIPPNLRRVQQMMSVFVEVGWDDQRKRPLDSFVFDCGSGVCTNYNALGVPLSRMNKVFLAHLHGDHASDLSHIYCFGPSIDRKSPLYVFGPGPSGIRNPGRRPRYYDDGTKAFCRNLRETWRWHTESFSFQPTSVEDPEVPTRHDWGLPCPPVPVGDDAPYDGFALVPIELDWRKVGGVAYHNRTSGVKVTHFPVVHCRRGSIGYKLEWKKPDGRVLTMIFTSDTRPETVSIEQARNRDHHGVPRGVDVFIHEMIVPPEVWVMKVLGLPAPLPDGFSEQWDRALADAKRVQNSSHTPQGAFGYLLSQINPRPRLTMATHFPVADDTVDCALKSVRSHVPDVTWNQVYDPVHHNIAWARDLMVLRVFEHDILQRKARVSDFEYCAMPEDTGTPAEPKYAGETDQIDTTNVIPAGPGTYCDTGY
jgi:ribonuclease Z